MKSSPQTDNPLGLNLDFMFGRGYLWAERHRLSDWIALESLRMEIPDLQFPFDARGGLNRFRHTRCLVRKLEVAISEVGLGDLLEEAAADLDGYDQLQVRFVEDAAHISFRLSSLGTDTYVSFRAALIPPEPPRADEVHLSLYDYRAYGPLPYPARLVVHQLVKGLLNTPVFRAPGRGASFTVGMAGDIISFRPLKLLLLHIFPKVGWKLPNLSGVVLESARIRPGTVSIRAADEEPGATTNRSVDHELAGSKEGARALAAYEAKELFAHADRALFDGDVRQAMSLLSNYRDVYGLNPGLVARILDCLLADASAANIAEAESIRRELVAESPDSLLAALVHPTIALTRRRDDEAIQAYRRLADRLQKREETRDWILCELALAELLEQTDPEEAAKRLRQVLKRDPRHQAALERLRELYERTGRRAGLEEMLKRLTGVYTDRDRLKNTYLELARHLMDRQGDLAEARMYLEKVLRLDGTHLEALHALGRSYVMGGEPLRALKAFGSAAKTARSEQQFGLAAKLFLEVGQLWTDEMEDDRQALLTFRQALTALENTEQPSQPLKFGIFRAAAETCQKLGRAEEAIDLWRRAVQLLERGIDRGDDGFAQFDDVELGDEIDEHQELVQAHRQLGRLYDGRDRMSAAASHFRRVLQLSVGDDEALDWLEQTLRQGGRPEELIELYQGQIEAVDDESMRLELIEKLADLYAALELVEEATSHYRRLLSAEPTDNLVRRKVVKLLGRQGRYETLRAILEQLLEDVRDRQVRHDVLMELGEAAEAFDDLDRAATAFLEAARLQVGERKPLESACRVLQRYVDERGRQAGAPHGTGTAAEALEKALMQLAEVTPSADQQREVLMRVAILAEERGDSAAAGEARRRADQLQGPQDDEPFDDVDARLDAMLQELDELDDSGDGDSPGDAGQQPDHQQPDNRQPDNRQPDNRQPDEQRNSGQSQSTRRALELPKPSGSGNDDAKEADSRSGVTPPWDTGDDQKRSPLPKPSSIGGGDSDEPDDSDDSDGATDQKLNSFRRRLAKVVKKPSQLPDPEEIEQKGSVAGSRDRSAVDRGRRQWSDDGPETTRMPADQFDSLREESDGEPEQPSQPGHDRDRGGWTMTFGAEESTAEELEEDTSPQIDPVSMARDAIEEARQTSDPGKIASAISHLLTLADSSNAGVLSDDEKVSLSKEAGELLYYEMDDPQGARPHLERVRRLEPQGRGANPEVVNALESIYENSGDVQARIQLLEQRLEAADDVEMKTTYRLLIAQTLWDQRDDADAARSRLREVLETDKHHEGAHRLLAQMATEDENWEATARHLQVVLSQSAGGIDAVETRRRLARILLRRLDRPKQALKHYRKVLGGAPGDAQALEGIKEAQGVLGDWAGYCESLGRELGLLLGNPDGIDVEGMGALCPDEVDAAVQVPASQIIADAAHILEEHLEDAQAARRLWGAAYQLWPEHAEALERRISLDRQLDAHRDLAADLESYAALVLDDHQRFDALVEAADIRAEQLDDPDGARPLYTEALALIQGSDSPPDQIGRVRRQLERLGEA